MPGAKCDPAQQSVPVQRLQIGLELDVSRTAQTSVPVKWPCGLTGDVTPEELLQLCMEPNVSTYHAIISVCQKAMRPHWRWYS